MCHVVAAAAVCPPPCSSLSRMDENSSPCVLCWHLWMVMIPSCANNFQRLTNCCAPARACVRASLPVPSAPALLESGALSPSSARTHVGDWTCRSQTSQLRAVFEIVCRQRDRGTPVGLAAATKRPPAPWMDGWIFDDGAFGFGWHAVIAQKRA